MSAMLSLMHPKAVDKLPEKRSAFTGDVEDFCRLIKIIKK